MFRSKVAGVFGAAVLLGVVAGTLAAFTAIHPLAGPFGSAAALAAADAATATASASASSATSGSSSPTDGSASPTSTAAAVPTATRTPRPIPTLPPAGSPVDLHGSIVSVSPNADNVTGTFVLNYNRLLVTCVVDSNTKNWPGVAKRIGDLHQGMVAEVQGTVQDSSTVVATTVDAQLDN